MGKSKAIKWAGLGGSLYHEAFIKPQKKAERKAEQAIADQKAYEASQKSEAERKEQEEIENRKKMARRSSTVLTGSRGVRDNPNTLGTGISRNIDLYKTKLGQ